MGYPQSDEQWPEGGDIWWSFLCMKYITEIMGIVVVTLGDSI